MKTKSLFLVIVMASLAITSLQAKSVYYVKVNGTGNGTSWSNAAGNIQDMIDEAAAGDEVWVAAGTYALSATLQAKEGVNMYGGLAGNETNIDNRAKSDKDGDGKVEAWEFTNETILSGINSATQNIVCVVNFGSYSAAFTNDTQFDGFTVSNGCLGIFAYGTITINNCIIRDNNKTDGTNTGYWGGIIIAGGTVNNCEVTNNLAYLLNNNRIVASFFVSGGGINNSGGTISNCVITNNYCRMQDNYNNLLANVQGGGIYNSGGKVVNCVVTGNVCYYNGAATAKCDGGGIYNYSANGTGNGIVANCLVTNNTGGGICNSGLSTSNSISYVYCSTVVKNSLYNIYTFNNGFDFAYNCIIDDSDMTQFVNPSANDYHLKAGSTYIDAGSLDNLPDWVVNGTDLAGNPRTHNGKISLGAYEYDPSYTGIQEVQHQSGVAVFPNPATDFITVSGLQGNETVYIYNINGQLLFIRKATAETEQIAVGQLPAGIYFVKTNAGQVLKWVKK